MPELSRFFGIVIRMFFETDGKHSMPHFHAYFGEYSAVFSVPEFELLAGSLPIRQKRLVEGWGEINRNELIIAWSLLQEGKPVRPIKPLE